MATLWKVIFQAAGKCWGPRHSPCDQVEDLLHLRKNVDVFHFHFLKFHFYQGAEKDALLCGLLQSLRVGLELWGLSFWTSPSRGTREGFQKSSIFSWLLPLSAGPPPTMGENHSFWLLKRFLIFQGISGDLDVDLLKHITQKIQWQIKRYFKFILWVI